MQVSEILETRPTPKVGEIRLWRGCTEFYVNGAGISPWASCLQTEW